MTNVVPTPIENFKWYKIFLVGIISTLMGAWLLWQYYHGGVESHHILHRKDLPEISNGWGGVLLPLLSWILLGRIESRFQKQISLGKNYKTIIINALFLFFIGIFLAILIVISFNHDFHLFLENVPYIFLLLSFLFPIFFSEFMLGFILGMTYTFGVILPTAFMLILAGLGFLLYQYIRPLILKIFHSLTLKMSRSRKNF